MLLLGSNGKFEIASNIGRGGGVMPYETPRNLPKRIRPLRIFALDPSVSRVDGRIVQASVPFEELQRGPVGRLFAVDMESPPSGTVYREADLDDHQVLTENGYEPDPADSRFHGQMVYSVAMITYEAFRKALGRHIVWASDRPDPEPKPLVLAPFSLDEPNAYYSRAEGAVKFGYFSKNEWRRDYPPAVQTFTSMSADVITHEVTHALLDGLRSAFFEPTSHDVFAFHEAFADLIAVFQRFTFKELVRKQIDLSRGDISKAIFGKLAPEIGQSADVGEALRTLNPATDEAGGRTLETEGKEDGIAVLSDDLIEPHDRGRVLSEAVFEAFVVVVKRRTAPIVRLATGGTSLLRNISLSPDLLDELVRITCSVAGQFRAMCIRAIDYCPPIDIDFGDYLRALITADYSLVADDPWNYREAIIRAFRRRQVFPRMLPVLSESSLLWSGPVNSLKPIGELALTELYFQGDPGIPANKSEIERQAQILGAAITGSPTFMKEAGLVDTVEISSNGDTYSLPMISSVRPARRTGPDGQLAFDLIAEVTQIRYTIMPDGSKYSFKGGSTIILNALGKVDYIISKRVDNNERLKERQEFVMSQKGKLFQLWGNEYVSLAEPFSQLCSRNIIK